MPPHRIPTAVQNALARAIADLVGFITGLLLTLFLDAEEVAALVIDNG